MFEMASIKPQTIWRYMKFCQPSPPDRGVAQGDEVLCADIQWNNHFS
jgi:hypothetical protein